MILDAVSKPFCTPNQQTTAQQSRNRTVKDAVKVPFPAMDMNTVSACLTSAKWSWPEIAFHAYRKNQPPIMA